jgi:demethylmenaquinone methyltransferase/2-methoxy-6-polyprenyl-1,4-benzoquinol methylase
MAQPDPSDVERFAPRAAQPMACMFDDVSARYDLLNRVMSLGQDARWREALRRTVPERAHVVLDLCTGSGVSLAGLPRPGRLVLGMDVSLAMLERAQAEWGEGGWAPRLVAADAFRLPLANGSIHAITIAFGVRNLRPRAAALAEIARVLAPGGTLAVLEAVAPKRGPLALAHAFYLERLIPLAGRFSGDPSAYRYLSRSVFEFGTGEEFESDLAAAGFTLIERRHVMFGAARLWAARRGRAPGENPADNSLQDAPPGSKPPNPATFRNGTGAEWWTWTIAQLFFAVALVISLAWALVIFINSGRHLPLEAWQRRGLGFLIVVGLVGFLARSIVLIARLASGPPRR